MPAIAYGIDAAFSAQFNSSTGQLPGHGIIVSASHSTSHVLPIVDGRVDFEQVKRLDVGGRAMTDCMAQLVHLQHPHIRAYTNPLQAEELKHRFCYITGMQQYGEAATRLSREAVDVIQLPFTATPVPTHAELMQKSATRREQGLRLQEISAKRRQEKLAADRLRLAGLVHLKKTAKESKSTTQERKALLQEKGFKNETHLTKAVEELADRVSAALHKALAGKNLDEELYSLVKTPDNKLTPQQVAEKHIQQVLKSSAARRQEMLRKREEALATHVVEQRQLAQLRHDDPEQWKAKVKAEIETLKVKQQRRRKQRQELNDRSSAAYRRRQKMINDAANDGDADDDFGANDQDWLVYNEMVTP